ncbi:cation:proton antiporter [Salinithrix halophila]|uniref:Cation:proton antiporter n=1 Tax=Salinithrix halophila TaxID=1485204 RepID=A0ABV8JGD5_9BACL
METTFELTLVLLTIAAGITAIAKKLNLAYPIALVVVGTLIGLAPVPGLEELKAFIGEAEIFRFAVLSLFLPALLGEAALKLPFTHLKENHKPILILALAGTLIAYGMAGWLTTAWIGLPLTVAFTFAALMAATDPVSVLSIFKSMGVNRKLSTIMEGESLVNDGIAVVLFTISSAGLLTYLEAGTLGAGMALLEFLKVVLGGLVIGSALSWILSQMTRFYDDYPLEIVFSVILFYGAYFVAEAFHVSGVIAVVAAGVIYGNFGAKIGMNPTTKLSIRTFWDVMALLANSLVFFMVGLEVTAINLSDKWGMIGLAVIVVLIARSVAVYVSLLPVGSVPASWRHIMNWGGLKGSLSIALALSLPTGFAGRESILVMAYGVVLFSLIVQGLTIQPLVRFLGVKRADRALEEYETSLVGIQASNRARRELREMKKKATLSPVLFEELDRHYEERQNRDRRRLEELYQNHPELLEEQRQDAHRAALYAEHEAVDEMESRQTISKKTADTERDRIVDQIIDRTGERN